MIASVVSSVKLTNTIVYTHAHTMYIHNNNIFVVAAVVVVVIQ